MHPCLCIHIAVCNTWLFEVAIIPCASSHIVYFCLQFTKDCAYAGLQASTVAIISLGGRVPQIWMNYQRGNSGELSIATCVLNLAGNLARIFTTLVLTKVRCETYYWCCGNCMSHSMKVMLAQTACPDVAGMYCSSGLRGMHSLQSCAQGRLLSSTDNRISGLLYSVGQLQFATLEGM